MIAALLESALIAQATVYSRGMSEQDRAMKQMRDSMLAQSVVPEPEGFEQRRQMMLAAQAQPDSYARMRQAEQRQMAAAMNSRLEMAQIWGLQNGMSLQKREGLAVNRKGFSAEQISQLASYPASMYSRLATEAKPSRAPANLRLCREVFFKPQRMPANRR